VSQVAHKLVPAGQCIFGPMPQASSGASKAPDTSSPVGMELEPQRDLVCEPGTVSTCKERVQAPHPQQLANEYLASLAQHGLNGPIKMCLQMLDDTDGSHATSKELQMYDRVLATVLKFHIQNGVGGDAPKDSGSRKDKRGRRPGQDQACRKRGSPQLPPIAMIPEDTEMTQKTVVIVHACGKYAEPGNAFWQSACSAVSKLAPDGSGALHIVPPQLTDGVFGQSRTVRIRAEPDLSMAEVIDAVRMEWGPIHSEPMNLAVPDALESAYLCAVVCTIPSEVDLEDACLSMGPKAWHVLMANLKFEQCHWLIADLAQVGAEQACGEEDPLVVVELDGDVYNKHTERCENIISEVRNVFQSTSPGLWCTDSMIWAEPAAIRISKQGVTAPVLTLTEDGRALPRAGSLAWALNFFSSHDLNEYWRQINDSFVSREEIWWYDDTGGGVECINDGDVMNIGTMFVYPGLKFDLEPSMEDLKEAIENSHKEHRRAIKIRFADTPRTRGGSGSSQGRSRQTSFGSFAMTDADSGPHDDTVVAVVGFPFIDRRGAR